MLIGFFNFFKHFFKKKEEKLTDSEILIHIENAINKANKKGERCIDVYQSLSQNVMDTLAHKGYYVCVHDVWVFNNCITIEEAPGIEIFEGEPTLNRATKICW